MQSAKLKLTLLAFPIPQARRGDLEHAATTLEKHLTWRQATLPVSR
jgi:hypothetical protein